MSNITEKGGVRGTYTIQIKRKDGSIKPLWQENVIGKYIKKLFNKNVNIPFITGMYKNEYKTSNLITNVGLASIADLFAGATPINPFKYIALGTGDTAPAVGDTALGAEITTNGLERTEASSITMSGNKVVLVEEFTYTGSTATEIKEAGIFNASTEGTMASRSVFTSSKTLDENGEKITVSYDLEVERV